MSAVRRRPRRRPVTIAAAALLAAAAGLPSGEPARAQDRSFQDWSVTCPQPDACVATSPEAAARILVGPGQPDQQMRLVVLVAREAEPDTPLALRLDDGRTVQMRVNRCTESNCQAIANPEVVPQLLEAMRGRRSCLVAYPVSGRMVLQEVSLMGLTPAVASIQR
jgi:invasion protein IalB